ncbi:MAG TPA: hypothetical protein VFI22_00360 [Thermomicrobiales bacterium]|nr:hypothetical protein [Thermomicrobiales bacterium]
MVKPRFLTALVVTTQEPERVHRMFVNVRDDGRIELSDRDISQTADAPIWRRTIDPSALDGEAVAGAFIDFLSRMTTASAG